MAEIHRTRTKEIRVKVYEEELQIAKEKANYCNLSMSDYIRKQIVDGAVIKIETDDIKAVSEELNKIGININQIARHVNEKGGNYDKQDMNMLIDEFRDIQSIIYSKFWGTES